ncbi:hypothetical protein ACFWUZ_21725 [Streptomyces sp. NPDC058646]
MTAASTTWRPMRRDAPPGAITPAGADLPRRHGRFAPAPVLDGAGP